MVKHPILPFACMIATAVILSSMGCRSARLSEHPDATLSAHLIAGPGLAPGKSSPLVVTATLKDGQKIHTRGAGKGTLDWDYLAISGQGIHFDNGTVKLQEDPRTLPLSSTKLEIESKENAALKTRLEIPLRFDTHYVADYSGSNGKPGRDGMDGFNGRDGAKGSADLFDPKPGENGTDGDNGSNGGDATPGHNGKTVRAWIALHPEKTELLQIKVAAEGSESFFLVDSHRGSLLIKSDGGNGALGGRGGKGGRGGAGGQGIPAGMDGRNGLHGRDGAPSKGGDGGTIIVTVDPKAKAHAGVISFSNRSGSPGGYDGPKPEIREETVPALW